MIGFGVERGYYTGLSCDCDWVWGGERLLHRTEL